MKIEPDTYPFGLRGDVIPDPPNRMHPGLGSLDLAYWLIRDEKFGDEHDLKRQLLNDERKQVLQVLPQSQAAQKELRNLVGRHLEQPLPKAEHPIEQASLMCQEDFCILEENQTGSYELTAGCVCFPSRWDLVQKIGTSLSAIHDPVPGFKEKLANPLNRLFANLQAERPVWRQNWALDTKPDLHQPHGHDDDSKGRNFQAEHVGQGIWLRTEYQTLRRLPDSKAIVFTIRNFVWQLSEIDDQAAKQRLAAQLATMPLAMSDYKSIAGYKAAAIAYLTGG